MSNIASISVKVKTETTAPSACEMAILTCAQQENCPDFQISSYSSWAFPSQPNFTVRYYDAGLGRFVGRDPLGTALDVNMQTMLGKLRAGSAYKDGMSLYRAYFVVNGVDPSGLTSEETAKDTFNKILEAIANQTEGGKAALTIINGITASIQCVSEGCKASITLLNTAVANLNIHKNFQNCIGVGTAMMSVASSCFPNKNGYATLTAAFAIRSCAGW
jgi:hypothetical protein